MEVRARTIAFVAEVDALEERTQAQAIAPILVEGNIAASKGSFTSLVNTKLALQWQGFEAWDLIAEDLHVGKAGHRGPMGTRIGICLHQF